MPKKIDPSKLTEEIDGEVQKPQAEITLKRPDGNPVVVPENMVKDLQEKGFVLAKPGDFTELREKNLQATFELANAGKIEDAIQLSRIVQSAVATVGNGNKDTQ